MRWLQIRRCSRAELAAVALGLVAVAGAAGCGRYYWSKPDAAESEFERDNRECAAQAAPAPRPGEYGVFSAAAHKACLTARGWVREKKVDSPPGWYRGYE